MSIIAVLLPIALVLGFTFLLAFVRSSSSGQYDDLETPAHRMLLDDEVVQKSSQPDFQSNPQSILKKRERQHG